MITLNTLAEFSKVEGHIGRKVTIKDIPLMTLIDAYETLIAELTKIKYTNVVGEDVAFTYTSKLLEWLRSTDFYSAPASTRYHDAVVGGLLVHTLNVYNNILDLRSAPQFANVDINSATLVALVHDWCKIGFYTSYERNVKNDQTGQWEKQTAFKVEQTSITLGHGVSSMFLASKFFRLTPDEALAIRWHMGPWRVVDSEMTELQLSNEHYPLVHLIQFADQLAITDYAN